MQRLERQTGNEGRVLERGWGDPGHAVEPILRAGSSNESPSARVRVLRHPKTVRVRVARNEVSMRAAQRAQPRTDRLTGPFPTTPWFAAACVPSAGALLTMAIRTAPPG